MMTAYKHQIPSRLQTTWPQLKNDAIQAAAAEAALREIVGVISVKASSLTGNMYIRYAATDVKHEDLLASIRRTKKALGLAHAGQRPIHELRRSFRTATPDVARTTTNKLGEILLSKLVEKCIQRSAIVLIAAVL